MPFFGTLGGASNRGFRGYGAAVIAGVSYKAIFGYGLSPTTSITNLVSNTGVVATDTTGVGTARYQLAAAGGIQ